MISVNILTDRDADPSARVLALIYLADRAMNSISLDRDDTVSLGQFAWSCGHADAWLAVGAVVILGLSAQLTANPDALHWLHTLNQRGSGAVRHTARQYLVSLGEQVYER